MRKCNIIFISKIIAKQSLLAFCEKTLFKFHWYKLRYQRLRNHFFSILDLQSDTKRTWSKFKVTKRKIELIRCMRKETTHKICLCNMFLRCHAQHKVCTFRDQIDREQKIIIFHAFS